MVELLLAEANAYTAALGVSSRFELQLQEAPKTALGHSAQVQDELSTAQVRVSEVHDGVSVANYSVDEFVLIARALRDRCSQPLTTAPPPSVIEPVRVARLHPGHPGGSLMHVSRLHPPPRVEAATLVPAGGGQAARRHRAVAAGVLLELGPALGGLGAGHRRHANPNLNLYPNTNPWRRSPTAC